MFFDCNFFLMKNLNFSAFGLYLFDVLNLFPLSRENNISQMAVAARDIARILEHLPSLFAQLQAIDFPFLLQRSVLGMQMSGDYSHKTETSNNPTRF